MKKRIERHPAPRIDEQADRTPSAFPRTADLTHLNSLRRIIDGAGARDLERFASPDAARDGIATAVFEVNGDYALRRPRSGWCRMMDAASRRLCGTMDDREALSSGRWLCHESCWATARISIETAEAADEPCNGGLRIRSVPIRAGTALVGAVVSSHGLPPTDGARLVELAARYGLPVEDLERCSAAEHAAATRDDDGGLFLQVAARSIGRSVERAETRAGGSPRSRRHGRTGPRS